MSKVEPPASVRLRRAKRVPGETERLDAVAQLEEKVSQLQQALDSRIVIEQAKAVIAERHGLTPHEAFEPIRRDARSRRINLHDLAAGIVGSTGIRYRLGGPGGVA